MALSFNELFQSTERVLHCRCRRAHKDTWNMGLGGRLHLKMNQQPNFPLCEFPLKKVGRALAPPIHLIERTSVPEPRRWRAWRCDRVCRIGSDLPRAWNSWLELWARWRTSPWSRVAATQTDTGWPPQSRFLVDPVHWLKNMTKCPCPTF